MALIEVKVPQLSESVAEATLVQWKKKPGQAVEIDEILVEIETDKVVLEVPAPAAGVLAQIIKNDGDSCIAEEVIAKIDTEGKEEASGEMQIKRIPSAEPAPGETPGVAPEIAAAAETKSEVAMPAAAKLMAEHDLSVGSVQGTGKGGRVTKGDVLEVLNAPAPAAKAAAPAAAPRGRTPTSPSSGSSSSIPSRTRRSRPSSR
ncbi:MAG: E3 binding domain-containing protein, partial [Pseudomonadota bacterium]|nr:E3 binding domain-containing protein [Pseudomonadota bacterium]